MDTQPSKRTCRRACYRKWSLWRVMADLKVLIPAILALAFMLSVSALTIRAEGSDSIPFSAPADEVAAQEQEEETPTPSPGKPIVIDTDMAIDDWMAIFYLLRRPDVDVRAITVSGTGEAHCDPGVRNALGLLALAGKPDIPVACGRETPLEGNHVFPASWRTDMDNMLGIGLPPNPPAPDDDAAVELLARTLRNSPEKITLVTLGPLTNMGELLQANVKLADNLAMFYVMGGAVDVPGNLNRPPYFETDNLSAEWNIYIDPRAAELVLESGAPVTLVSLDATNNAPLSFDVYQRLEADRTTPEADFVYQVLTAMLAPVQAGHYYFWDPLTAGIAIDESLATVQDRKLRVITEEGPEIGRTAATEDGYPVRVCAGADGKRFQQVFLDTLNGREPE